jgi:hypothetical protein
MLTRRCCLLREISDSFSITERAQQAKVKVEKINVPSTPVPAPVSSQVPALSSSTTLMIPKTEMEIDKENLGDLDVENTGTSFECASEASTTMSSTPKSEHTSHKMDDGTCTLPSASLLPVCSEPQQEQAQNQEEQQQQTPDSSTTGSTTVPSLPPKPKKGTLRGSVLVHN